MWSLIIAAGCAGLFAGAAIYINAVEHPARISCGSALALREFAPSYRRGNFSAEEFDVESVHDGVRGLERAQSGDHALVILDLLLPGLRGLDVLQQLRSDSTVPVLILTARGEDVDRVVGLELGADDYLPKPFNSRELMARVRAILRRTRPSPDAQRLEVGDVTVDPSARRAWRDGQPLNLTMAEFVLLEEFLRHAGHVLSRERPAEQVLGRRLASFDRRHRCAREQPAEEARRRRRCPRAHSRCAWRGLRVHSGGSGTRITCAACSSRSFCGSGSR